MTKETKRIIQMIPATGWKAAYKGEDEGGNVIYKECFLAFVLEETTEPGIDTFYSISGIDRDGYTRVNDASNFIRFVADSEVVSDE